MPPKRGVRKLRRNYCMIICVLLAQVTDKRHVLVRGKGKLPTIPTTAYARCRRPESRDRGPRGHALSQRHSEPGRNLPLSSGAPVRVVCRRRATSGAEAYQGGNSLQRRLSAESAFGGFVLVLNLLIRPSTTC